MSNWDCSHPPCFIDMGDFRVHGEENEKPGRSAAGSRLFAFSIIAYMILVYNPGRRLPGNYCSLSPSPKKIAAILQKNKSEK